MAASPFLLSPLLETQGDFIDLYESGAGRNVGQFLLSTPNDLPFAPHIDVEFLAVPRPVMSPAEMGAVRGRLRFPFANLEPETITPPFRQSLIARYLHAPAEAVWPLTGPEREFRFHFGIDPEAYERGTTNGVDFIVELRGPSGGVQPLFKRSLRPRQDPADRGDQAAHVVLPIFAPGSRLVLRTGPGEFNDNSWDWAWVNQIALTGGKPYAAELFPGFNRVPDSADAENAAAIEADGAPALVLHVPGKVGFTLTGTERKLLLKFGFLPGAYTDGGRTTGGDIIVEVARAGQPPRELSLRRLQPVTVPADRGPQTMSVDLAGIAAGDILTVRTAPIPGGNASWGWTYLSRLVIE
jgi:hypothetical protein